MALEAIIDDVPQTQTDFRRWVSEAIASLLPHAESDESDLHREVARLIRKAKLHATTLGLTAIAARLPEVRCKTPLDGILRLQEIAQVPNAVPEWLTIQQVASYLGISVMSVRRRADDGQLPEPTRMGRLIRWKRIEIENL